MSILLETDRLILRQWEESDEKALINIATKEHVQHWNVDWVGCKEWALKWIQDRTTRGYQINDPMKHFMTWAIILKSNNQVIGMINVGSDDFDGKEIGIWYFLDMDYENHGYMTEAVIAFCKFIFDSYQYDHLNAIVQPLNHSSNAVIKKTGFKYESTINKLVNGQTKELPFYYYRLDNPRSIVSVREHPEYLDRAVDYFSSKWGIDRQIYHDSISDSITTNNPLPRWYLMLDGNGGDEAPHIIGSFGLIENDFMVRKDLKPWLCALYVEESERCKGLGGKLLAHGCSETQKLGFDKLYLCTDHVGYYEKYSWQFFGMEESEFGGDTRVYMIESEDKYDTY